jgi:hypothetical protein
MFPGKPQHVRASVQATRTCGCLPSSFRGRPQASGARIFLIVSGGAVVLGGETLVEVVVPLGDPPAEIADGLLIQPVGLKGTISPGADT